MTERSEERQATAAPAPPPRRWLQRLKVNQFRSVEPGTELCFSDGLHAVLGKNATGKSTLLDLVVAALALDFDRPRFNDEPLDLEFTLRAGSLCIDATVKRTVRDAKGTARSGHAEGQEGSLYEEGHYVMRAPSGFAVTVVLTSDDIPRRTVEGVSPSQYGLEEPLGWRHQAPPLAPRFGGLYNTWFEGSLKAGAFLEGVLGEHWLSFGGSIDRFLFRMPEGDDILEALADEDVFQIWLGKSGMRNVPSLLPDNIGNILDTVPRDGSAIEVPLALDPLLSTFIGEMGFTEARMSLGPPRVERYHGEEAFKYTAPIFSFYRERRLVRRDDQLSYGQRRLFALGWYLACNRDVAILDEPSNGLHESWVEFLVSQFHDRQVFLTTQNREALDMLPFATEEEISHGFVRCESRPEPGGGEPTLRWRGLREDESALMIKALRASRVDLVSDLLRAMNLW
jgi:hypothetical protein